MEDKVMRALIACPLFAGMSPMEIEMMVGNVKYHVVKLPAHDVYALAGMPCRYVASRLRSVVCTVVIW